MFLTTAPVDDPFVAFDAYDRRSLIENTCNREVKEIPAGVWLRIGLGTLRSQRRAVDGPLRSSRVSGDRRQGPAYHALLDSAEERASLGGQGIALSLQLLSICDTSSAVSLRPSGPRERGWAL